MISRISSEWRPGHRSAHPRGFHHRSPELRGQLSTGPATEVATVVRCEPPQYALGAHGHLLLSRLQHGEAGVMAEKRLQTPGRIFINYRREDTAYAAVWLFDRLSERFGDEEIFKDVDSIELGDDFVEKITAAVASCDVFLLLIGDRWLTVTTPAGVPRLRAPDDFVRLEIEAALERDIPVIPILVDGAEMPGTDRLPSSIASLSRRQALELSPSRFDIDVGRLLGALGRMLADVRTEHSSESPSVSLTRGGEPAANITNSVSAELGTASPADVPTRHELPGRHPMAGGQQSSRGTPSGARRWLRGNIGRVAGGAIAISIVVGLAVVVTSRRNHSNAQTATSVSSAAPAVFPTALSSPPSTAPPPTAPPATAPPTTAPAPTTILISPQTFAVARTCELSSSCGVQLKAGPSTRSPTVGAAFEDERLTVVC